MPEQDPGGGGNAGSARQRLLRLINRWTRLNDDLDKSTDPDFLKNIEDQLEDIENRVDKILTNRPKLVDVAENKGWDVSDFVKKPEEKDDKPKGGGGPSGGGGGGHNHGGGGSAGANWFLPGVRGKDYSIYRYNGRQYATWQVKIGGHTVKMTYRLPSDDKKLRAMGVDPGTGRSLTRAQFKKLDFFGNIDKIRVHGENKHPFETHITKLIHQFKGTEVLRNKEVMGLMLQAASEKWDPAELQGMLRTTDWYKNSTAYSRRWNMEMSQKERNTSIGSWQTKAVEALEDLYGFNWQQHVKPAEVRDIAQKIASGQMGAMGNPDDGFAVWFERQEANAEKIDGTPAWIARSEKETAQKEFMNRPEDMFEQLREQAIQWLGYAGKFDRDTLKKWAEDLVFENKSDADWQKFLRQQKQAMYPYLDPDTPWMDFASPYKSMIEELMGQPVSWEDSLLRDLSGKGPDGSPLTKPAAMSLFDFERAIKKDARYWDSKDARDTSASLVSFMDSFFNGAVA